MSHYAVLVIGDDVEKQLAKFDENLETPRYVEYTKEEAINKNREDILDYKKNVYDVYLADVIKYETEYPKEEHLNYLRNEFPKKLEWTDEELYADFIEWYESDNIGPNGEIYSERNPNSKWDWWTVGGRYRDRFPIKQTAKAIKGEGLEEFVGSLYRESKPNYGDIAFKKDIDWDIAHKNQEKYNRAFRFWELKVEGQKPKNKEEKEELEHDWYKVEYYTDKYKTKETYATAMSNFTAWAIVKDGKWYEKGEMGMFGMSDETNDAGLQWELNFYDKFIKDLPDDTLFTMVDCHI